MLWLMVGPHLGLELGFQIRLFCLTTKAMVSRFREMALLWLLHIRHLHMYLLILGRHPGLGLNTLNRLLYSRGSQTALLLDN